MLVRLYSPPLGADERPPHAMWIKNTQEATSRLYDAELDVGISFNENGTAQVADDVGAELIDHYNAIEVHETDE